LSLQAAGSANKQLHVRSGLVKTAAGRRSPDQWLNLSGAFHISICGSGAMSLQKFPSEPEQTGLIAT
jgi:hypothetical protein